MTVIFLDIDGVLINRSSLKISSGFRATPDPNCVDLLNQLLDYTQAEIVVSSTWRIFGLLKLTQCFQKWGISKAPLSITPNLQLSRGFDILYWLELHQLHRENTLILDDDCDLEPLCDRHIKTQFEIGLTTSDIQAALNLLGI